jgi:YD repeat-containing protein
MTYDAEGHLTNFSAMSGHVVANAYNERGELASSVWTLNGAIDKSYPNLRSHGFNGVMVHDSYGCIPGTSSCSWQSNNEIVDPLAGAITSSDILTPDGENDFPAAYQYDSTGRMNRNTQDFGGTRFNYTGTSTKAYDAENRMTTNSYANWGTPNGFCGRNSKGATPKMSDRTLTYDWGASGHPVRYSDSSRSTTETLHWDGDTLAFTTNAAGQLDDLKFGNMADYTPRDSTYTGITFWDRDPFGAIASAHNASGFGTWTASSASHGACTISDAPPDSAGYAGPSSFGWVSGSAYRYQSNGLLLSFSADGLSDGFNSTNGIRTLDGQSSAWTVPDPYAGAPTAPQSQKAYVYAGNDPAANGDPSGYLTGGQEAALAAYFKGYDFAHAPPQDFPCTSFVVHAFMQALGVDLNAMVASDHYFPGVNGYELYFHAWSHPAERVHNLHNFLNHRGEVYSWDKNVNKRVGDILFCAHVDAHNNIIQEDVHVAIVSQVDSAGRIQKIAEGTSEEAIPLEWEVFQQHLKDNHYIITHFARLKNIPTNLPPDIQKKLKMAIFMAGVAAAASMMSDSNGGWITPGNENLRYY